MTIPPNALETPSLPDAGGAKDAQGSVPRQRPLLWTMFLANFGVSTLWGSIGSIFLAVQLQTLNPDDKVGSFSLAISIGAFAGMIAAPIVGTLSDRTRTRIGGRAPWMIVGLVLAVTAAVLMAFGTTTVELIVEYAIMQIGGVFVTAPLVAHIPDRVPMARRGIFSSLNGLGIIVGAIAGQTIGAAFSGSIATGYIFVAVFFGVTVGIFLIVNSRQSNAGAPREQFAIVDLLRTFWVNPIKNPDFFWAFLGRLLIITGYYLVSSFGLYILQDYIGLNKHTAIDTVPILGGFTLVGIVTSTLISGPLSDKLGRRKVFIFISSAFLAVSILTPFVWPTITGMFIFAFLSAFGFGGYQSVDYALVTQVLPSQKDAGRDLGIINISSNLPQTFGAGAAGLIVTFLGGYAALFPIAAAVAIIGALAIIPIRSVK
jgi:MFS family permease